MPDMLRTDDDGSHTMNATEYEITMPGKVYDEFCESSMVPTEESWPTPTWTRCGRGHRVTYMTTPEQALDILTHVGDSADVFAIGGCDDDARAAARVALRWYHAEMRKLATFMPEHPELARYVPTGGVS